MTNHYATLGVAKTATQDEIKRAFRRLASQHHPDKGGDTQKFQEIQAAYDTLGDPAKRQAYDAPQPQFHSFNQSFNMHDIFGQMFGQQSPFGGQHPRRGHVRMTLWIQLVDVATGGRRTVSLGTQNGVQGVEIDIPRGIEDDDNVQYQGLGPGGSDLVVNFRIHGHANWQRQSANLITEQRVPLWDLILGGEITVRDILNQELVTRVPAGTQPGTMLRLRGRGLPHRDGGVGDIFVRVQTQLPTHIAPEIREAIEKYRE
jgi:DnaJ-class molecular chaperone